MRKIMLDWVLPILAVILGLAMFIGSIIIVIAYREPTNQDKIDYCISIGREPLISDTEVYCGTSL